MGKSNRIRNDRANVKLSGVKARKKKQGMPSWAINLIAILVAVLIFASVAISLMSANGIFNRMQTAVKSDHFRVDANMMNYFFKTQYNNFVQSNSSYLSYYGLDTGVSLKEQYVGGSEGEDAQTWFDYMMDETTAQVEELLVYCEEAYARDIELDDDDEASIDEQIAMYKTYAQTYQYSDVNSYIAAMYGKGIKEKDIRNAIELTMLASKCSEELSEELENALADTDITAEYDGNKLDYDLVDYSTYTFNVTYEDVAAEVLGKTDYTSEEETEKSAEILERYKQEIENKRTLASLLKNAKTVEAFEDAVAGYIVGDVYDETYETAINDSDVATDDLPDEEETKAIREELVAYITDIVKNAETLDKEDIVVDGKVVGTDFEVSESYADAIKDIAADIAKSAADKAKATFAEGTKYSDADDIIEWAFEDERAIGDTTTVETGDGADGAEISETLSELKSFSVTTALLVKSQYKNETPARNVGIMVFTSQELAASVIAELSEGVSLEDFENICEEVGGTFSDYKNYMKGSLGVDAFDTWLYGDDVKVGSYTLDAISLGNEQYAVAVYYSEGDAEWYVNAKNAILTEQYEELSAEIKEKYTVEVKDSVIAKIDG